MGFIPPLIAAGASLFGGTAAAGTTAAATTAASSAAASGSIATGSLAAANIGAAGLTTAAPGIAAASAGTSTFLGQLALGTTAASGLAGVVSALQPRPKPVGPQTAPAPPSFGTNLTPNGAASQNPQSTLGGTFTPIGGAPSTAGKTLLGQ